MAKLLTSSQNFCKLLTANFSQLNRLSSRTAFQNNSALLKKNLKDYIDLDIQGRVLTFPSVWLRDNCRCEQCLHPTAKGRTINWSKFNVDVQAENVTQVNDTVQITWDDGHTSQYENKWLNFRSFTPENQENYQKYIYKPEQIIWHGKEFENICSKHDYKSILTSDNALYNFLHKLSVYGVAVIENTPDSDTALAEVIEKIGFPKETHYGKKFIVQHLTNTNNVAYLSDNLQMHCDLPYYEYCPGVNMLHCVVQTKSKGGENLLSDGHYVANYMKENYPEEYQLLVDIEVEWSDIGKEHGKEFYKLYRCPVICLDKHKNINRINFSISQRGSHFPGRIEDVKPWFKANALFLQLNHQFSSQFKTKPGEILVFDNIRLLHGRNKYEDSSNNVRKLIGTYIDWDEVYSK